MMNVKEASKAWGCSIEIVREYCKSGLIISAEKQNGKWIFEDMKKPPFTVSQAKRCLEYIGLTKEDANTDMYHFLGNINYKKCYYYLNSYGFIKNYNINEDLPGELKNVSLTKIGEEFLKRQSTNTKKTTTKKGTVEANLGPVKGTYSQEVSEKEE